ncbi:MAG: glycine cleavage system aminomethyltransferase GcvT [Gemmataceae bacterium]|nr:glycine cleavage system aminomethyltransferase GcvT [Gemmataceae bacterium]MDW8267403.1 glycine cleavage system aminomethyltransferase GcvT [Gemmataceae bacterium]
MALRTPLYDWHTAHHGRMVEFAGWLMPLQYSRITDEHQAVRTAAGVFDISHMGRIWIAGPEALDLVQLVYTNNAATLRDGQVRYGLVCNVEGGIRDDVLVYRFGERYLMVVNAANREKILGWLIQHGSGRPVEISDQTGPTAMLAVQGPCAVERCQGLTTVDAAGLRYYHAAVGEYRGKPCLVSRTGYTGEDGLELIVDAALATQVWEEVLARGAQPCGLGARDTLRLEAALPLYGHELSEEIDPFQAGLGWAVKFDKGDFIGRDALLRRRDDERRRRVGLVLEGKRIARDGASVWRDGREIGTVTSGTFAPTVQRAIALAYVEPAGTAVGTEVEVDVRGQRERAKVVALPFYRRARS